MASRAVVINRMALNPSENTVRGQRRIKNYFIDFLMNLEEGVDYHGFTQLKPIELGVKTDKNGKPADPEEYSLNNFCALQFSDKCMYIEAFIVNIRKQVAMDNAFYYDISVCFSVCLII